MASTTWRNPHFRDLLFSAIEGAGLGSLTFSAGLWDNSTRALNIFVDSETARHIVETGMGYIGAGFTLAGFVCGRLVSPRNPACRRYKRRGLGRSSKKRLAYRAQLSIQQRQMRRDKRSSGPFRQALSERGLLWAVDLSRRQNVYPVDVALIFPIAQTGKPRKYHIPDQPPVSAEALLAGGKWQKVSWRRGTKGRLTCLFAARRVRVADGHKHRMLDNRMQCMPGDEVWLVGERRSTGEQKYYVSNLPADASLKMLAATIKARWVCEQAHQQLKEELGLDHFEGRSWTGLHRHALMTMIAYAFLQSRRLKAAGRKKKNLRTATTTKHAGHQASDPRPLRTTCAPAMSSL